MQIGGQSGPSESVSLTGTTWNLAELSGEPVVFAGGGKTPYLLFHGIAPTVRACPDMELESRLFKALEMVDNHALKDGMLSLHKARMAPLARFEASQGPQSVRDGAAIGGER